MGIVLKRSGSVHELAGNPLAAFLKGMFNKARFHRGLPSKYAGLNGQEFEQLDEANREHVIETLRHRAKALGCPVSDLMWAISPQQVRGIHPVMVKRCEIVEREEFERKGKQ